MRGSIEGAYEIAKPVTFAVLTTVAAFSPLLFVPGMLGKVFRRTERRRGRALRFLSHGFVDLAGGLSPLSDEAQDLPTVNVAVAITVPTIQRMSLVSRFADFGADAGDLR